MFWKKRLDFEGLTGQEQHVGMEHYISPKYIKLALILVYFFSYKSLSSHHALIIC